MQSQWNLSILLKEMILCFKNYIRTYIICTPDVMYKMTIIVSNRKTFLFIQSVTGWQNFLRRRIDLSTSVEQMHYHIRLTVEATLDLQWWLTFLPLWSGSSLALDSHWTLHRKCSYLQMFLIMIDGLGRYLRPLVTCTTANEHCREGIICHCYGS